VPAIQALLFDMDGTLIDSESQTDAAIAEVMRRHGIGSAALPPHETRGRTWSDIVAALRARYGVNVATLEDELAVAWADMVKNVEPIRGAPAALQRAHELFEVSVVSSSPRALIEKLLAQLDVARFVDVIVGAEDVTRFKPDPEGFLRAARLLGAAPPACVVFEDSSAGMLAARRAGMASVLIKQVCAEPGVCAALATAACSDYSALAPDFWARLAAEGVGVLTELT
jgi:sugar-phosphatase